MPYERKSTGAAGANPQLRSPMLGAVVAIFVEDGTEVEVGAPVLSIEAMKTIEAIKIIQAMKIIEAMKMEHVLRASVAGTVVCNFLPGEQLSADQVVASIVTVRDAPVVDDTS